MQEHVVEVIRELMKTQGMSIRKISAQIAKENGGSDLGYTQQINRILNDPDYDPNFSTVEKILSALKSSLWQTSLNFDIKQLESRLDRLSNDVSEMKQTIFDLSQIMGAIAKHLDQQK
ncbi:helix-turn-helix domain-containing protein [Myxacorys almedinensis]|uniref:XRE family transcriptional regulator n=1 Tax=Myxacorys almedinensis A TaxID=2690445 RepID=A0A8J8CPN5_9CYAN|nr:helix-turn-helix transcriptional regulator [Myxacorys almedinensis]NDJ19727.1 XRE family transcriptional regulator [Myxacorys almedinensis A]